jgi:16S rRNA (adenine1518-N6/adenine1519-N6)-dimethyltransferase
MLQYRFHLEWLIDVPPESFDPPPKVQSAVVRLIPLVQTAFSQRRKMLRNTLKGTLDDRGFSELGIAPTCRAEDVAVADYVRMANYLT